MPLKSLTSDRHLQLIERILHDIITVQFINSLHNNINIRLLRLREQQKLRPRKRLKASEPKRRAFKHLNAGSLGEGDIQGGWG